jgi:hypothetical protein
MIMAPFLLCGNEGSAARRVEEMTGGYRDSHLPPLKAPITDAVAAENFSNGPRLRAFVARDEEGGTMVPLSPASEGRSRPA